MMPMLALGLLMLHAAWAGSDGREEATMMLAELGPLAPAAARHAEPPWWEGFDDPLLSTLMAEALEQNNDLRAAWARTEQARGVVQQNRAGLLPQLSFDVNASVSPTSVLGFNPAMSSLATLFDTLESLQENFADMPGMEAPEPEPDDTDLPNHWTSGQATLGVSLPVDIVGRQWAAWRASAYDSRAAEGSHDAQALVVAQLLAEAWYDLVAAVERRQVIHEQEQLNRDLLDIVELRFDGGTATALDVLQQRQQLAMSQALGPQAASAELMAQQQLALVVGRAIPAVVDATLPELPAPPPHQISEGLLDQRPDLVASIAALDAARSRHQSARRSRAPSLALTGQAGWQFYDYDDFASQQIWSVGGALSVPLYQGGGLSGGVQAARGAEAQAQHQLRQAVLQAVEEVRLARLLEEQAELELAAVQQQHQAAEAALVEARARYGDGLTNLLSVTSAINALLSAELSLVQARRNRVGSRIRLHTALGGHWPERLGTISTERDIGGEP